MGSIFETIMLVCFGLSWPMNLMKAYKAGTARGTSLWFILLIITGYISGISAKIITGQINYVLIAYLLNLAIVSLNLVVYFRNVSLDKKSEKTPDGEEAIMYEQELKNYRMLNELAEPDGIVIFGGNADRELPLCELKQAFSIEQGLYNRSLPELSVRDAAEWYADCAAPLHPETVLLHLGEADRGWFAENSGEFDRLYRNLIAQIRKLNKKCRIAVLSLQSPADDPVICEMNRHLRYIAESERCEYGDLAEKRVWNPKETKEVASFVQAMGLVRSRRTMYDLVKILFGCTTVQET